MASSAILSTLFVSLLLPRLGSPRVPSLVVQLRAYKMIPLMASVTGPESLAFDSAGGGPYTGVSDGRVLKWEGPSRGWTDFSTTSRNRDEGECNGSTNTTLEDRCGRPLGIQFLRATGDLYIADAYFGLLVVGPAGGPAAQVAAAAEGGSFGMTNGLNVDQESGVVYFTDSSTQFQRREWVWSVATRDATGRFLKYDPRTKRVTVLLRGLQFPNGVALNRDASFAVISESTRRRVLRYWLKGPNAGSWGVFAEVPGYPDNIKRNRAGEFWVGVNSGMEAAKRRQRQRLASAPENIIAVRLDEGGRTVEVLEDRSTVNPVSEVVENNGTLWLGSAERAFVGIYTP